jgi:quinol monooxygenase YgiN
MSTLCIAEFFVKPDRSDEFLDLLAKALVDTRAYDGCEKLETFVDQDDPGHVVLVETWRDRADHQSYLGWRAGEGALPALAEFVTAAPKFAYLDARPEV